MVFKRFDKVMVGNDTCFSVFFEAIRFLKPVGLKEVVGDMCGWFKCIDKGLVLYSFLRGHYDRCDGEYILNDLEIRESKCENENNFLKFATNVGNLGFNVVSNIVGKPIADTLIHVF